MDLLLKRLNENKYINNSFIKVIIPLIFPVILGGILSSLGNWDYTIDKFFKVKIALLILVSIVTIITLYLYYRLDKFAQSETIKNEDSLKKEIDDLKNILNFKNERCLELEQGVDIFSYSLNSVQTISELTANNIWSLTKFLINNHILTEQHWSFSQACTMICNETYHIVDRYTGGNCQLEISYIQLIEDNIEGNEYLMMNAYKNQSTSKPSILEEKIPFNRKKKQNIYFFYKIFQSKIKQTIMFLSPEDIKKNFWFRDEDARLACKYKQYIAIPVFCNNNKILGVMQIASLSEDAFINNKEEVGKFISTALRPFAFLALMLHKIDRAILTLATIKNN